ncbi:UNC93-like protein 3 [Mercurialis annua]|uniref:UNC93-like protein 3 n=1 Tax=Mercurialis annua TaxID=3986 RepID=UPI00215FBF70|nr:UNC93-like protein 3 [Mercurialis annua]
MATEDSRDEETPLVLDNLQNQTPPNNHTKDIHILSSAFLLVFLAYGAAQNLQTTVNTEHDLGTISLGILYLSFTFFSLIASLMVKFLGSKNAIVLGTTGYWFFIAANLMPTWYTMVPASLYLGFAASIIWVGQGTYLTSAARSHATDHGLHEGAVIGSFNGEFWGMFACHQLVGNLISLAILRDGTGGSTSGTTLLFIVFLCVVTLGIILMCFLSKRVTKEEEGQDSSVSFYSSLISKSKSVITPLLDIRMLLIVPLIAYSGLQQAFVWAEFTKEIVTPALGVSGVGGSMAVYGAFDAICSLTAGRLTSGLRSITWIVSAGAFLQAIVFFWILLKYSLTSGILGVIYPLLMAALLGIGDGVLMTQLSALLGILFKHDMEGAFAQLKVWQSASIAVVFFIYPYISLPAMVVVMIVALCVALIGFLILTLQVEKAFSSSSP